VYRLLAFFLVAGGVLAQCRLPDPAPDSLSRLSAEELVDSGHYLRAAKILEPVVATQPDNARAEWLLSRSLAATGDLERALKLADAALASDASNAAYHVQVAAVAGRLAEKSSLLKQLTLARRARQELDAATALDASNIDAQWGLMIYYYAAPALIGGDKAKAVQIGEQMAALAPAMGRYYQGRLALQMKEADKAEAFFRQSVIDDPVSFETAAALAGLYIDQKPDQARAEKWACQAVHADPTRGDGWALLAKVYTMCGCWTEALDIADRAVALVPENLDPKYEIAAVAVSRGEQLDLAVRLLREYLASPIEGGAPAEALAHMQLGFALAKQGANAEAIAELKTALEQDSSLDAAKAEIKRVNALRR